MMDHPYQQLRTDANQILALMDQGFPFSLGEEERKAVITEAGRVLHKLDSLERNVLGIGLLGGTGVGKSTLMNALAGSKIASASRRRPHTDHVLIYRHREAPPLPFLNRSEVPFIEVTHSIDSIERILLCDLPDFDSIASEHRERVIRFLEHLDLLIWVTSLEKYGDARFYEFLGSVPKSKQNFVFVLNKLDLLFQENDIQKGYDLLARTMDRFQNHLRENGMEEPLLYGLAAEQAVAVGQPAHWNQFPLFRQYVFQQRDIKEIRSIRTANLDVELKSIFSLLERETIHLRTLEQFIETSLQELETRKSEWILEAEKGLSGWLSREWSSILLHRRGSSALVGPGQAIDLLTGEFRRMGKSEKFSLETTARTPLQSILSLFKAQVEEVKDSILRRMLMHSLPGPLLERMETILNVSARVEAFEKGLARSLAVQGQTLPSPSFRWFRIVQHSTYAALFLVFLVAIGGRESWEGIIASPDWRTALRLLVSWINTLFSGQGLAALGSYMLLNFYVGFRFYRRHRRKVESVAVNAVKHGIKGLLETWENHIQSLADDLNGFRTDIRSKTAFMDGKGSKQ
ncbi:MAG: hypothetical protein CVU57_02130 [Deltaproteobacteria bacterium HGW-Deltaproteobacteria-15]|nr:MAG: hypothetical protein CVU57_02130 [Deltaproteobacteria bacterium HGW-Deltaproteobacteria-15]